MKDLKLKQTCHITAMYILVQTCIKILKREKIVLYDTAAKILLFIA